MPILGHLPFKVRGYCGTCGKEFGEARPDCFGYRINCAHGHLAQVIPDREEAAWWLRKEAWLLRWQTVYSPFSVLRRFGPSLDAGLFILISFGIVILALVLEGMEVPRCVRWAERATLGLLAIWRFVDILLSNTSITFTSRFPVNPLRSVVLTLAAYVQIVLSYGWLYCVLSDPTIGSITVSAAKDEVPCNLAVEAVFYSFGTIATVGYGLLKPVDALGKALVSSELVFGLYFVVIVLAQVAAWNSHSKVELGRFEWEDLAEGSSNAPNPPPA